MKNKSNHSKPSPLAQKGVLSEHYRGRTVISAPKDWLKAFCPSADDLPEGHAFLSPQTVLQARLPLIAASTALLKQHSPTGKALLEWADRNKISFTEKNMRPMGIWSRNDQYVAISTDCSPALATSVIGHEIFHAVQQNTHQFKTSKPAWDFQTEIFHTIAGESGAFSTQCRIAYEMKLSGYADSWDALIGKNQKPSYHTPMMQKYIPIAQAFENAYQQSIKDGITDEMALRHGVSASQEAYTKSDAVKQVYAKSKLNYYFNDVINGKKDILTEYHVSPLAVGGAYLNEKGHFIAQKVAHPKTEESLFGHDLDLMHLVRHIEDMRTERVGGKQKTKIAQFPSHSQIIRYSGETPNPYAHLSFEQIKTAFDQSCHKSVTKTVQVLNKRFKAPQR